MPKVHVTNHYTEETRTFEGSPNELEQSLEEAYPWVLRQQDRGLRAILHRLNDSQVYSVNLEP